MNGWKKENKGIRRKQMNKKEVKKKKKKRQIAIEDIKKF